MNNLLKKIALISVLCLPLLCLTAYGQTTFQSGYVIDYEGDTVRGLLKEQFTDTGYNILFKRTETDDVEIKKTNDIQKYSIGLGYLYETHKLLHKGDPQTLFLQCLILGDVSLYGFIDDQLHKYYYIKTDELGFRELKYGKEICYSEEKGSYMKNHNGYVGTLKLVTQACPDLAERIDKLKFTEQGVIDILKDFHYCINRDFVEMTSAEKRKGKIGASILTGANFIVGTQEDNTDFINQPGFDIGVFINYIIPNSRNRYSAELGYLISYYYQEQRSTGDLYYFRRDQIPIIMNTHFGDEKNRYNLKVGYYYTLYGPAPRSSNIVGGIGYDRKIGKIRLRTNVEYRWGRLKTVGIHAGIGF